MSAPTRHGPLFVSLFVGALIVLMIGSGGTMAQESSGPDPGAIDQYIEDEMAKNRVPGLAVAITRGDEVLHLKGYGTAGDERPMTPQTQFYTASLSKSFTALAVMQLMEEGKIKLDAPVQTYLPDFTTRDPEAAARITVRHLLNQTSGLADAGFPAYTLPQPESIEERVESLRDAKLVSEPGEEFYYTDLNYAVLARLVEVVSGEPFSEYLHNHIFDPLRMKNTTSVVSSAETPRVASNLAQGHILAFGIPIPREELDGYLGGSGGVISTAEDMANYLIMQNNNGRFDGTELVTSASGELMHTPPDEVESSYAMGWMASDPNEEPRTIEHNGVLSTLHADMALLPDEEYGIVLLYNHSYALADYEGIKRGLIDLLAGQQPESGGPDAGTIGIILAALMLVTTALQVRGLIRLRKWAHKTRDRSLWLIAPGILWKFVPAALLIGLQPLVGLFAGRVFSYWQLFLAMPDVVLWLMLSTLMGTAIGVAHIMFVAQSRLESR